MSNKGVDIEIPEGAVKIRITKVLDNNLNLKCLGFYIYGKHYKELFRGDIELDVGVCLDNLITTANYEEEIDND